MKFRQSFISLEFNEEDSDLWGALQLIKPEKRSAFIKGALRCTLVAGLSPECFYSEGALLLTENVRINNLPMTKSSEKDFLQDNFDAEENSLDRMEMQSSEPVQLKLNIETSMKPSNDVSVLWTLMQKPPTVKDDLPAEDGFRRSGLSQKEHFAAKEESNLTEAESEIPLPLIEVGVLKSDKNQAPWEHLLYNIIGVEEDEAILDILNKASISHNMLDEAALPTEDSSDEEFKLMDNENPSSMMQNFSLEDLKVNTEPVQSIGVEYVLKQVIGVETDAEIIELLQSGELLKST